MILTYMFIIFQVMIFINYINSDKIVLVKSNVIHQNVHYIDGGRDKRERERER